MFFSKVFKTHWSGLCFCQSAPVPPTLPQRSWFSSPMGFLSALELADTPVSGNCALAVSTAWTARSWQAWSSGLNSHYHLLREIFRVHCTQSIPAQPLSVNLVSFDRFSGSARLAHLFLYLFIFSPTPNRRPFWSCSWGYLQHSIDQSSITIGWTNRNQMKTCHVWRTYGSHSIGFCFMLALLPCT